LPERYIRGVSEHLVGGYRGGARREGNTVHRGATWPYAVDLLGFLTAQENGQAAVNYRAGGPAPISTGRTIVRNRTVQQPAYNHYARNSRNTSSQPVRSRSFWQKHRDKLTVAAGTGGGALIGGLLGGKKGALIGGLAGAGGSALYTYKLRKRTPKY